MELSMDGWIKLHRRMLEWEWYTDANAFRVFVHLILIANRFPAKWRGVTIDVGQRITSLDSIAESIGLSKRQVRTAIDKLKATGEVVTEVTRNALLVTVCNYETYQTEDSEQRHGFDTQMSRKCHADDTQLTPNKKEKKEKKENNTLFDEFWTAYDLKKNRKKAEQAWRKTRPEDRAAIITAAKKYRATITDQQYQKHATTWLNGECWNDDLSQPEPTDVFAPAETMTDDERNALLEKMQHMTPAEAEAHRRFDAEREKLQAIWIEAGLDL